MSVPEMHSPETAASVLKSGSVTKLKKGLPEFQVLQQEVELLHPNVLILVHILRDHELYCSHRQPTLSIRIDIVSTIELGLWRSIRRYLASDA